MLFVVSKRLTVELRDYGVCVCVAVWLSIFVGAWLAHCEVRPCESVLSVHSVSKIPICRQAFVGWTEAATKQGKGAALGLDRPRRSGDCKLATHRQTRSLKITNDGRLLDSLEFENESHRPSCDVQ